MCPIPVDVIEKSCTQVEDLFDQFLRIDLLTEDLLAKVNSRESNEVQYETFAASRLPPGQSYAYPDLCHDVKMEIETLIRERDESSEYQENRRSRARSQGPTEQEMHDAALIIARVGDQIERQYGGRMAEMKASLSHFIKTADKCLSYETFAVHVDEVVGDGRDCANFMCVMHVSRQVLIETNNIGRTTATDYFRRYLGPAFAEEIAERNDVVQFVRDRPSLPSSV